MRFASTTAAVVALAVLLAAQAGAQTIPPTKIAVVNPVRVLSSLQETKDLQAKIDGERKSFEAAQLEKQQKLRDLQAQRDTLKPETAQYQELNKQLMNGTIEYESWGRITQSDIQRQQKQQIVMLFNKISDAIGEIAKARGIDMVVAQQQIDLPENLEQIQVEQLLMLLIRQRTVLYNSDSVDVTAAVIAAMDARYKSGK